MTVSLIAPALGAALFGSAAGFAPLRLHPTTAVRVLTGIAVTAAATVGLVVVGIAVGFLLRSPALLAVVEWCPAVAIHSEVGPVMGLAASAATAIMGWRVGRVLVACRRVAAPRGAARLTVLETAAPIAYAAPGRPGSVVVSRGLLDQLEPRERHVVIAHERGHLHSGHHRQLAAGELAVAVLPFLRPLVEKVRLATELSADEYAVDAAGGDRRLVATTIARVAVTTMNASPVVGSLGGASTVERIIALTSPAGHRPSRIGTIVGVVIVAGLLSLASVQAHHVVGLLGHLCHL